MILVILGGVFLPLPFRGTSRCEQPDDSQLVESDACLLVRTRRGFFRSPHGNHIWTCAGRPGDVCHCFWPFCLPHFRGRGRKNDPCRHALGRANGVPGIHLFDGTRRRPLCNSYCTCAKHGACGCPAGTDPGPIRRECRYSVWDCYRCRCLHGKPRVSNPFANVKLSRTNRLTLL